MLDFLDFFFFFFFAAAGVGGGVAVVVASSSTSSGDGGGVRIWTGSAAVEESVSEVEVMRWKESSREQFSPKGSSRRELMVSSRSWAASPAPFQSAAVSPSPTMHLMYTLNENGDRVYTLKVSWNFPSICLDSPFRARK